MTKQKTVLIGVTGCIAAYKSCELVRLLQKRGYRVKVCMTKNATEFVGPTTFRALTHEPVAVDLFSAPADPIYHISLAEEADIVVLAPCTANVLAKIAHGIADDLLTTTVMASTKPLIIAPAMNVHMYESAATRENIRKLKQRAAIFVDAEEGYLACGESGKGRMAEPSVIADEVEKTLQVNESLQGKKVLITAGPTQEPIDSVRYLSNYSSGKMGYALAQEALKRGAEVVLVSGPVALDPPQGAFCCPVQTAQEMYEACMTHFSNCDIAIFSAAVCDMRPNRSYKEKLKKGINGIELSSLELVENPDILASCASLKEKHQCVVGFAAETNSLISNAQDKLTRKNADIIVANDVSAGKVFGSDYNEASLVYADHVTPLQQMPKQQLAQVILDACLEFIS